jgi:NAD(P)-dependent dehydrogenase (short-subunit alcohol dehydrogenase family)
VLPVSLDVTSETDALNAVKVAVNHFGRLDVLVNNAGYGDVNSIEETSMADFRSQIETNLFGTIIVTKAALPYMRKQRAGHIIQFSSVGGRIGPIGRGAYAAAKWGVEGFSEVLSKEVAPFGIKVTIIEPGGFRTDFAGISSSIRTGLADYDSTVGAAARFQQEYNGHQPGDPVKAAEVIALVASIPEPPLRLLLGTDAVNAVEKNDMDKIEVAKKWRHLSLSTDFVAE